MHCSMLKYKPSPNSLIKKTRVFFSMRSSTIKALFSSLHKGQRFTDISSFLTPLFWRTAAWIETIFDGSVYLCLQEFWRRVECKAAIRWSGVLCFLHIWSAEEARQCRRRCRLLWWCPVLFLPCDSLLRGFPGQLVVWSIRLSFCFNCWRSLFCKSPSAFRMIFFIFKWYIFFFVFHICCSAF